MLLTDKSVPASSADEAKIEATEKESEGERPLTSVDLVVRHPRKEYSPMSARWHARAWAVSNVRTEKEDQ